MNIENPFGTTPVQTAGDGQTGGTTPAAPQATETVEELRVKLADAERKRADAEQSALSANRAVEAGRKFEKFEGFATDVETKLNYLKEQGDLNKQTIEDLKSIISQKAAVTPNFSSSPSTPAPVVNTSEEELRTRNMFGLPITQK